MSPAVSAASAEANRILDAGLAYGASSTGSTVTTKVCVEVGSGGVRRAEFDGRRAVLVRAGA